MAAHKRFSTGGVDVLRFALITLGVVLILAGMGVALLAVLTAGTDGTLGAKVIVSAAGQFFGCVLVATLLFAAASALRLLTIHVQQNHHTASALEHLQAAVIQLSQSSLQTAEPTDSAAATLPAIATPVAVARAASVEDVSALAAGPAHELLTQIRDLTMMDEPQRKAWAARHWAKRKELLTKQIEKHITTTDWAAAFARMDDLRAILPDDSEVLALRDRLVKEQALRLREDVTAARTQARHLMSITAWQQAQEIAAGILKKYPHEAEAQSLAADVQREYEAFERENMERLFLDLSDATEHRQWRRAVHVADELVKRYSHEKRVEKLKHNLPTMKENADAAERKEQEELFKDLLNRHLYDEAAGVAKSVIEKFPNSTAAQQLMKLLPKVEELIKQEKIKKQQLAGQAGTA